MFARCSVVRNSEPDTAVDVLGLRHLLLIFPGHKILINNEEVDLTASEFKLLPPPLLAILVGTQCMELVEKVFT